ncbi:MAG TPA: ABC transporter permease [Vicinamibacterales bacterium]
MRQLIRRVWYAIRRRQLEADLAEEIEFHRAMKQRELVEAGVDASETPFAAQRALGNVALARDQARDVWISPSVQGIPQDVRFACRLLLKDRRVTLIAVIALALGIASTNTIFTLVNAMVWRGLPVERPHEVVAFRTVDDAPTTASFREIEDWRAATTTFTGIAAYSTAGPISMRLDDRSASPDVFFGAYVEAGAFRLLGESPILGRDFVPEDDQLGATGVVLLGHTIWTSRYGGDRAIIGQTIRVNGAPRVVVGVMPEGFRFPVNYELWLPLMSMPGIDTERRDVRQLQAFGRLVRGATIARAQAEMNAVAARLSVDYPATNKDVRPLVRPFTGVPNRLFTALLGAVGFLLLIACANVAHLMLVRSPRRSREISIRSSLGATRWRIVRQLLVECLVVALAAGTLGFALSIAGVRLYAYAVSGIDFPYWYNERWTMDGRVFTFLATVCIGTGFLFGLVPALQLSRCDVNQSLKTMSRTSAGDHAQQRWAGVLLIVQVAFTLTLLAAGGLMMRSFVAMYRADGIVDASRILTTSLQVPVSKYATPAQRVALYERLEERLSEVGPVSSASVVSTPPFIGAVTWHLTIDGQPSAGEDPPRSVSFVTIGPRYFETLGLTLQRGRPFTTTDGAAGQEAAIVTNRFVTMFFPNQDPIGRRICVTNPSARSASPLCGRIVGVSPTIRQQFQSDLDPVVYFPYRASPGAANLMIRGHSDARGMERLVRDEIQALDPDIAPYRFRSLDVWAGQSRMMYRVFGSMFAIFAWMALALSAVGLYAVTSYAVAQRVQEIGVRVALGAQAAHVVWLFVRQSIPPLAIGVVMGMAGALGAGGLVRSLLVDTGAADPLMLISVALLFISVAMVACFIPARRAARLDPVTALRQE